MCQNHEWVSFVGDNVMGIFGFLIMEEIKLILL